MQREAHGLVGDDVFEVKAVIRTLIVPNLIGSPSPVGVGTVRIRGH